MMTEFQLKTIKCANSTVLDLNRAGIALEPQARSQYALPFVEIQK